MRRVAAAILVALCVSAPRASAKSPWGERALRAGETVPLAFSETTLAASATFEVPAGVEALHVFASLGSETAFAIEEGPTAPSGAFLESIREREFDGRGHLVRRAPSAGPHRVVLTASAPAPASVAVEIAFDAQGAAPILDLARDRLSGAIRRFRLYVPPHEGLAELSARSSSDPVRVLIRNSEGAFGKPASLPVALPGTEPGGLVGVDVLEGSVAALAHVRLVVPPAGGEAPSDADRPRPIRPGAPVRFTLGGTSPDEASFELPVPAACAGYRLTVSATSARKDATEKPDPDVFVRRGRPVESPLEDADFVGVGRGPHESLHLGGTDGLLPGAYQVRVELPTPDEPADLTLLVEALPQAGPPLPVITPLPIDVWVAGDLHAYVDPSLVRWYAVAPPEGAGALHVQVVDATSDVDLLALDPRTGAVVARSLAIQIDEALALPVPPNPPASYAIGVFSRTLSEDDAAFRIAVAADRAPALPSDLRLPPFSRAKPPTPTEAIAEAVAEIQVSDGTGSAVCIGRRGYLLTCRHVVVDEDTDDVTTGDILVAFPDDFRRAPRQAFRARVVASDKVLDLALLKVEADVYDRPVPTSLALPILPIGDAAAVRLGDPLLVVGYPGDGSERSRPPVTLSRGIVAGLEADRDRLVWIKTDAWIATGHSGGAIVDAGGRLVGLAAATLGDHDAMGLVRPTSLIPPAWLREAGVAEPQPPK